MDYYNVEFTPDKKERFNAIIFAKSITEAYIEFVKAYPKDYIITNITGVKVIPQLIPLLVKVATLIKCHSCLHTFTPVIFVMM